MGALYDLQTGFASALKPGDLVYKGDGCWLEVSRAVPATLAGEPDIYYADGTVWQASRSETARFLTFVGER